MCEFVFDPTLHPGKIPTDDKIECPYPSIGNLGLCIFHLFPNWRSMLFPTQEDIQNEILKAIISARQIRIVCTSIHSLDLTNVVNKVHPKSNIDVVYSTIEKVNIKGLDIEKDLNIISCTIDDLDLGDGSWYKPINILNSRIENLRLTNADLFDTANFENSKFGKARFVTTTFKSFANFCSNPGDEVRIRDVLDTLGTSASVFEEIPEFMGATFNRGAVFAGVKFNQGALLSHAQFLDDASFYKANFSVGVDFNNTEFAGNVDFSESDLGMAGFPHCIFKGHTRFDEATFGNEYTHLMTTKNNRDRHRLIEGINTDICNKVARSRQNDFFEHLIHEMRDWGAVFDFSTFQGEVHMTDVTLEGNLKMSSCDFEHIELSLRSNMRRAVGILHESDIQSGSLGIITENCYYEVQGAKLGNIDISVPESINTFHNIYIENTSFSGFDFSDFRGDLKEIGWKIDGAIVEEEHIQPLKRETTYTKAKSGASMFGDKLAESKFFILERNCRRERYLKEFQENSRKKKIRPLYQAIINYLYDALCKYGESSKRVVGWSMLSVLLFTPIYNHLDVYEEEIYTTTITIPIEETTISYDLGGLIISIQAFSSFLVGNIPENVNPLVQLLSSIQSFIGAFAIALFVATVVRKVER